MKDAGIPWEDQIGNPNGTVFFFPVAAPEGAVTRDQVDPISHLELWKIYNEHWSEHQVSITVSIKEDEWMKVGAWVYDNFDELTGVSFLPMDGGTYKQAPYTEVTKEQYEEMLAKMPESIDWTQLQKYELEDGTTSAREFACTAGACEIL